jgi:glycolate oxidase
MLDEKTVAELQQIVGPDAVLHAPEDLIVFEFDTTIARGLPDAVVFPSDADQVSQVVRLAGRVGVPVVARGAGTGLSGGSVPVEGGIVVVLTRMNRILKLDPVNRLAIVEPGVVNLILDQAARKHGLFFAPDPSSQRVCTIGGNVAENAGGPHCLAYGVTTNHVLGLELVLADGSIVEVGGMTRDLPGYDLTGVVVGSEGTLAIVTKAIIRLLPEPETGYTLVAQFKELEDATNAVSAIIAAGIVPQCMELSDREVIRAIQESMGIQAEPVAGAILIVEVEGLAEDVAVKGPAILAILEAHGSISIRQASEKAERDQVWAMRKAAVGALGRVASNYYVLDGVVPRTRLPELLKGVYEIAARYGLRVVNVFHAGDGNLHPNFLFDAANPGETERVLAAAGDILRLCVEAGGSITGEHGVGFEKRDFMRLIFNDGDLAAMARVRAAFGGERFNPGKLFPSTAESG